MERKSIETIRNNPATFLTPAQVAAVLGWDAQYIRLVARRTPNKLPFPVLVHCRRTQIPKAGFLEWWDREVEGIK